MATKMELLKSNAWFGGLLLLSLAFPGECWTLPKTALMMRRTAPSSLQRYWRSHAPSHPAEGDPSMNNHPAVQETWNWCKHFVVAHSLCPWAAASIQTPGAVHIRVVEAAVAVADDEANDEANDDDLFTEMEQAIEIAAGDFRKSLTKKDPNSAITFVVLAENRNIDFGTFYNWFIDLEDEWIETENDVTLAAFHPDWCFASSSENEEQDLVLSFEKRSPYPTVSIVSADVIDKAGPAATEQIGHDNAKTLLTGRTAQQWQVLYEKAIRRLS